MDREKDKKQSIPIERQIGDIFLQLANALETGTIAMSKKIGLTIYGSDHGLTNMLEGAMLTRKLFPNIDLVLIGPKNSTGIPTIEANTYEETYKIVDEKITNKELAACVCLQYSFPIGVSTVGKIVSPGSGKIVYISSTSGLSSTDRIEALVKNTIHGIIAAKVNGIRNPSVGLLNIDGARLVLKILKQMINRGYNINLGKSRIKENGPILRGNDLLTGETDVVVTDTLTGNLLMKMFSSYNSGGIYEVQGYGYGPGIGEGYQDNILVISRASGAPVIANAVKYASDVVIGDMNRITRQEYSKLNKIRYKELLPSYNLEQTVLPAEQEVNNRIDGIDMMQASDALETLWKSDIYATGKMGCSGPEIYVEDEKEQEARLLLQKKGFISRI